MRSGKITGLVMALVLAGSSAAVAQQPENSDKPRGERGKSEQMKGRKQGGFGALLKGIDLTDAQKDQLKALRQKQGDNARDGQRGPNDEMREKLKDARQSGDTAAVRHYRTQAMSLNKQRHEAMITEIRGILTPAQREVFDRNVVEAQKRMQEHDKRGGPRQYRS